MSLSVEELLKPRYKVIADYPGCGYPIGEILVFDKDGELYSKTCGYLWTVARIIESEVHKFKHLVRELEWWEERNIEDMPEYVKLNPENTTGENGIFKVFGSKGGMLICHSHPPDNDNPFEDYVHAKYLLPATTEEYLAYINSKK